MPADFKGILYFGGRLLNTFLDQTNWHGLWDNSCEDTASLAGSSFDKWNPLLRMSCCLSCLLTKWSHLSPATFVIGHLHHSAMRLDRGCRQWCAHPCMTTFKEILCAQVCRLIPRSIQIWKQFSTMTCQDDASKIIFRSIWIWIKNVLSKTGFLAANQRWSWSQCYISLWY